MEGNTICPYPGLRPFNEDEAIFFKGREEHIEQIVKQLEEKKFLMLTGASGDGKSSLVYAGVIPNARAGFFKAKFNNWIIADFRPEREPLRNMAIAINQQLNINDADKVEKEFSYGFSALVDLYKASSFWVDQQSENFRQLTADEQKKAKRKGANLLILVDQFEEFFTNPENYIHGKTSIESQAVVNLLLETTRLSIEQDLPIYIICTMRSDYIGQCASFRGLPEYIGYSQFFVPRLKRQEIYQVIEEPAQLNGNKISKRLVEMLINEMNDGIDQLPVLQHALNQIWQKAERGLVEMDLIHFAKINGIPQNQLPIKDQNEFEKWFDTQAEFKKNFFKSPSLGAVLDAHANELYECADAGNTSISKEDAKLIVETTFKCLTKIDASRAVRNRMSLEEVTNIINKPHITTSIVAKVLEVFRIQGNTFLKPFIFDHEQPHEISENSVLDITHESLIRNWNLLSNWAQEEYESYLTWQDFNKQLQRWINSGKSSGYLLPIGPLTFFEHWYKTTKPNKHWLTRYDEREVNKEQKLAQAEVTLVDAKQFIKRSTRRLFLNRTVIKYGADKIIGVFGVLLLVFGCLYFYMNFSVKQNKFVVFSLQLKSEQLLKSKYIKNKIKADYILVSERLSPGSYKRLLKNIESDTAQMDVVREMYASCLDFQEQKKEGEQNNPMVGVLFLEQLNLLETQKIFQNNATLVRNVNNILQTVYGKVMLNRIGFQTNDKGAYDKFCHQTYDGFLNLLNDTAALKKIDIDQFNKFLQVVPVIVNYDTLKLNKIADLINPFNTKSKITFDILYPKDNTVKQDWNKTLTHNGGYFQITNLFALTNNFIYLNRAFDSIILNNKNFLNSTDGYNYNRILYDLIITNKLYTKEGIALKNLIVSKQPIKSNFPIEMVMLNNILSDKIDIDSWKISHLKNSNWFTSKDFQLQLEQISYNQLNSLTEHIVNDFLKNQNLKDDEKNYMAALLYKAKAFTNNKKDNLNYALINESLKKSLSFFDKISKEYLLGDINLGQGSEIKSVQRAKIFKYGGLVSLTNTWDPFSGWNSLGSFKDKSVFIDFMIKEKGLDAFYFQGDEEALNSFLLNCYELIDYNDKDIKWIDVQPFKAAIEKNNIPKKIDKDALLAFLTCYYNSKSQFKLAEKFAKQINKKEFLNREKLKKDGNENKYYSLAKSLLNYYWFYTYRASPSKAAQKSSDGFENAFELLNLFPDEFQKRNALIANIDSLQKSNKDALSIVLMDSLINVYVLKSSKFGNKLFELLGRLSTANSDKMAMLMMKDKSDKSKPDCLNFFISGKAQNGYYYQATTFIPDYVSSSSQLSLYTTLLKNEVIKRKKKKLDGWSVMDKLANNNWIAFPYEEGENNEFFFSASD